jgi:hypothetical protein
MVCRMCKGSALHNFLNLGFTPPADQFKRPEQLREPETYYPLAVAICDTCGLVQLTHVVSPEVLYRNDYPYESSTTSTGRAHWSEFARTAVAALSVATGELAVDIGCNVGVLLQEFKNNGCRVVGLDPAANIVRIAERKGLDCIAEFFGPAVAREIVAKHGPAMVITATNVFAHVDDLDEFMHAVDILLDARGSLIIEAPYLLNLLQHLEYDTIYHEHLSYLSVTPLVRFFRRFGFELFDVLERDIHGGSLRFFVCRTGVRPIGTAVDDLLRRERAEAIHSHDKLATFARDVENNRQELLWLLRSMKHAGKRIVAVSAPAKGMTLLNYCRIGTETLDYVTEKAALKIGRYTPGTHVPVVSDQTLVDTRPDYALLLAWNFADEIMNNLQAFRNAGGRFIIPIPVPRVV